MKNCGKKVRACALYAIGIFSLISASYGQTFTVAANPSSLTIYPGQQNVPVAITVGNSTYTGPITVTLTGLPSGLTVSPLILTAGSSGTLEISASLSAGQEGFSNTEATSWTAPVTVVGAAGSAQATSPLSLTISISNPSFAPAAKAINLPIVNINTGGVAIVSRTTDVPGTITITSANGQTSYLPNASDSDNTATFHVHGHSTANMPKLSYHVKLNTSLDLLHTMGLSCPYVTSTSGKPACDKSKSYILLANYDDKTFLRDWAASALANAIPIGNGYLNSPSDSPTPSGTSTLMPWAPHSLFVELYLNGVYEGNYQLIEQIKVDSHRVNINELAATDTLANGADITGGYLLEIDWYKDEDFVFTTPDGLSIGLIDPDFTPEVSDQTSYISAYVDTAETALFSSNFTDPTLGWRAYFDEASALNFYIVNDVTGNVDGGAFYSSNYLYKDRDNPLLYMGPIWDFDISAGNVNYAYIVNPTVPWMQTHASWYVQWFADPGFKADVVTQWNTLKQNGVFTAWLASIQQQAKGLEQSQVNNFGRWPMQGIEVWPNPEAAGSYDGEVAYFTNWLTLRVAYLDSLFNNRAQTYTTFGGATGTLSSGSPVTLTAQVTGGTSPTGTVSFLFSGILLGTGSLDGSGAASLTTGNLPTGTGDLQAVYSGDSNNALSASTIQAVTVTAPLAATVTSIASSSLTASFGTSIVFTASVIGNSGTAVPTGTVTFSVDDNSGTAVTLDGTGQASYSTSSIAVGTHSVTAAYSGDTNYSASSGTETVTLSTVPLVITASSASMTYGGTAPTITPSYSGFVNGDTASSLTPQPTCSTTATSHSPVGSYPSSCSGAVDPNYSFTYVPGNVTVGKASLTITASNGTMTYGGTPPTVTPIYSAFAGSDTVNSLTTAPTCTTTATSSTPAGTDTGANTCSGAVDPNYSFTYVPGNVTVGKALLTITASSGTMTYGGTVPTITPSYSGFANGDTSASLTTQPTCSTTATAQSSAGSYPSTCSGAVDPNYSFTYVAGNVTVEDFTFAPPSGSSTSATAAPGQAATYTLSVGGEGGLSGTMTFTCTGAPSEATCTVLPNPVTVGSSATNVTVTVTTTAPSASAPRSRPLPPVPPLSPGLRGLLMFALVLAAMAWATGRRNQPGVSRWQSAMVPLTAGLLLTLALAGCGGGGSTTHDPGTPAGTYTLTVTGTTGSGTSALSHSVTLTLIVS